MDADVIVVGAGLAGLAVTAELAAGGRRVILDPKAGPLIAVKLHILTRKTLGGLETDLSGRVLRADGEPPPAIARDRRHSPPAHHDPRGLGVVTQQH